MEQFHARFTGALDQLGQSVVPVENRLLPIARLGAIASVGVQLKPSAAVSLTLEAEGPFVMTRDDQGNG